MREVSRSFYLTLRVLPGPVRAPIGLAYLLARTTDTIADTELLAVEARLQALSHWRERIMGRTQGGFGFYEPLAKSQASEAERVLLRRGEEIIRLLDNCAEEDRARIRTVLDIITSGQELDLQRFGSASVQQIIALQSDAELDDYTYRVAGCVGSFWTDMCLAHLFRLEPAAEKTLRENGVRFGKGLQLINILRDLPRDLRSGRCYLPATRLAEAGLSPTDLLSAERMNSFRPLYDSYLDTAEAHLTAGWDYTNSLPRRQSAKAAAGLRLADIDWSADGKTIARGKHAGCGTANQNQPCGSAKFDRSFGPSLPLARAVGKTIQRRVK